MEIKEHLVSDCIDLLKDLISTPSFSKKEEETATLISKFLIKRDVEIARHGNNVVAFPKNHDPEKPYVWLNSHHDTVEPNKGYTRDPFTPEVEDGKLYGLGSNDAGGALVSLLATFLHFWDQDIPFNLLFIASAEEEISGAKGMEMLVELLPEAELAIVGEPTQMKMAIAEKGLIVIDAEVKGKAGHAARNEGINALYLGMEDLLEIRRFDFKKNSPYLGKTKVTATIISSGKQHNVIPDLCNYTLDVRVNEEYSLEEVVSELEKVLHAKLTPRSLRLKSSKTPTDHLIVKASAMNGTETFGSPTLSDQALIPYPSVKIGPGDSARSHTADEYIFLQEIEKGVFDYVLLIEKYIKLKSE